MGLYKFTAIINAEIEGEVHAETEEEARNLIENGQIDDCQIVRVDGADIILFDEVA